MKMKEKTVPQCIEIDFINEQKRRKVRKYFFFVIDENKKSI